MTTIHRGRVADALRLARWPAATPGADAMQCALAQSLCRRVPTSRQQADASGAVACRRLDRCRPAQARSASPSTCGARSRLAEYRPTGAIRTTRIPVVIATAQASDLSPRRRHRRRTRHGGRMPAASRRCRRRHRRSASARRPRADRTGCRGALWTDDGADGKRVKVEGIEGDPKMPCRCGPACRWVIHGTDDGLVPRAFSSAPLRGDGARAAGAMCGTLAGAPCPAFRRLPSASRSNAATYLPLLPHVYEALDRVDAHPRRPRRAAGGCGDRDRCRARPAVGPPCTWRCRADLLAGFTPALEPAWVILGGP